MTPTEQKKAAKAFVERWKAAKGNEQSESNKFWIELFHEVLGVANPTHMLDFERKAKGRRIDVFYEDMGVLIENKSRGVGLDEPEQRGWMDKAKTVPRMVTPFEQAKDYANDLPFSVKPRWVITCNFDEIRIYDLNKEYPEQGYEHVFLHDLPEEYHRLSFLVDKSNSRLEKEKELSFAAGTHVGSLYRAFEGKYTNVGNDEREQKSLNILLTRLVFLLYADDASLLARKDQFIDYLGNFQVGHMRTALLDLFAMLDTPEASRDPYASPELLAFPYINGGLFRKPFSRDVGGARIPEDIILPQFDDVLWEALKEASDFDWSKISPTIFGAVFESTLNPETRRAGGMHYTTIEAIHKLTGPLFYDELAAELAEIEGIKAKSDRDARLRSFKRKLGRLQFFDPACGSGNFLTETYIGLRKMENRVLEDLHGGQMTFGEEIEVTIDQFHGIEINDFAVEVAKTALWIAKAQMDQLTKQQVEGIDISILPLEVNDNIVCGNALKFDWEQILPATRCDYIIGNPPFLGYSNQNAAQKEEMRAIWRGVDGKPIKAAGKIDYVSAWYYKASAYMKGNSIAAAFVSTNSICQGDQVAPVWGTLSEAFGTKIFFAWRTFVWDSEAKAAEQAHVHVVIVGFSTDEDVIGRYPFTLFDGGGEPTRAKNINGYLADAPDVFVKPSKKPPAGVPAMQTGNRPADGGHLIVEAEDLAPLLAAEPEAKRYIRPFLGSREFINGLERWCLWLVDAAPAEIAALPVVAERVQRCRQDRLAAPDEGRRKLASTPHLFREQKSSEHDYLVVPAVSGERRRYIPIGYVSSETICSNLVFIVLDGGLYEFGIIASQMHNAWMRAVGGRLKSDYRYSQDLVYNTYPWPSITPEQRQSVEACAQAVLDARAAHIGDSLAQMYDGISPMPSNPGKSDLRKYDQWQYDDLREAHAALDAAVEAAYGVDFNGDEEKIVAHLFKLYAEKTEGGR